MKTMKIKLLGQDIEISKVNDPNYRYLDNKSFGSGNLLKNRITIGTEDSFRTILHEISHFWIDRIGVRENVTNSNEYVCDQHSTFISTLVYENGIDIIEKLYNFANDKTMKDDD